MSLRRALPHTTIGWLLAVAVLVMGLVAMHSLAGAASSCSSHPQTSTAAGHDSGLVGPPSSMAAAGATAPALIAPALIEAAGFASADAAVDSHCGMDGHGGALCLAVLLGLALMLLIRRESMITRRRAAAMRCVSVLRVRAVPAVDGVCMARLGVLRL